MKRLAGILYLVFLGILSAIIYVVEFPRVAGAAIRYICFWIVGRKRSYHDLYMESEVINNICGLGFLLALVLVIFAIN